MATLATFYTVIVVKDVPPIRKIASDGEWNFSLPKLLHGDLFTNVSEMGLIAPFTPNNLQTPKPNPEP